MSRNWWNELRRMKRTVEEKEERRLDPRDLRDGRTVISALRVRSSVIGFTCHQLRSAQFTDKSPSALTTLLAIIFSQL